jgi:phospholipid/cholesterol/gamma-HCH transport system substrate-binding protein
MANTKGDNIRLGLFVLAGTVVLIVGLYMLGSKQDLFSRNITVTTTFQQVGGLRPGNNVRYAGINVGTVKGITIVSDTSVLVEMAIRADEAAHIRDNAVASLGSDGLMGNKLVNIGPGVGPGNPVADGTPLRSSVPLDTDQMMRTLDRTNVNMASITDDLRVLAQRLNTPGSLVHLLSDTVLSADLKASLGDLRAAAEHARNASASVEAVMADVRAGKGAIGTLVGDPAAEDQVRQWLSSMQTLADSLASASAQIDRFTTALNTPGSLGHTLTQDTAVAGDVRRTLSQLERSSVILEEDLKALQSNWLFKSYFEDQEKERKKEERKNAKELKREGRARP